MRLPLRRKLLLLPVSEGSIGMIVFSAVIAVADRQLFVSFVPENRIPPDV